MCVYCLALAQRVVVVVAALGAAAAAAVVVDTFFSSLGFYSVAVPLSLSLIRSSLPMSINVFVYRVVCTRKHELVWF